MKIVVQVQVGPDNEIDRCFLSFDAEGRELLRSWLSNPAFFRKAGDHVHLLSKEWGSGELSSEPYFEGCPVVHHLEIYYLGASEGVSKPRKD